jgi:glycosyltransferase involved in cell wall biosynthesis
MKHLSIIVPVYNVEPYVEKCLRSLEDQDIPKDDYEILCINDGSSDNSREIIVNLQKEFDNIILIDQENQGVSRARNNGIDKAQGTYMLFIDADDFIDANCLSRILKNSDEHMAQVSFLGYCVLTEDGRIAYKEFYEEYASMIRPGIETYFLARGDGRYDADRMWAVLFRTDFLNKYSLRYLPNVPYLEDGEFIDRILCLAEQCIFDGHSFYYRTIRIGSATQSDLFHSQKATNGFLLAAVNLKKFQQEQSLTDKQKEFLNQPIVQFVVLAVTSSIGWKLSKKFISTVMTLRKSGFKNVRLESCSPIYTKYGRAYNLSPFICALVIILHPRLNRVYISKIFKKIFSRG